MFKSEAELFLSANNNINYAKTLINECKRIVGEMELQGNSDYTNCKNNILNCDIDSLVDLVETTKESLFKLDQSFASEYMTLIQEYIQTDGLDTSQMTEEELLAYSIQMSGYERDYNYGLLYTLEKYEESGMLTPELEAQLEVQRTIVNQYEVQDQMSVLDPNSQEYIDLYKQNADYDRQIIMLSPNLTEEEKSSYLAAYDESFNSNIEILELNRDISILNTELEGMEYGTEEYYAKENEIRELQINYYEGKTVLTPEEQQHLEFLRDGVELNELYIDKEQNNGFWHPFIESEYDEAILDKKIEMNIATEDEIAYDKMNGWERAWENTKTFTTSFAFGVGSVTESVVDGTVMLLGEGGKVLFNADTQWAEDFVSIHYADDAYTGLVLSDSINSVSAYSGWHTAGNVAGSTTGYVALSLLPGGKVTTAVTGGLSAMGSSSQRAFDYDASYHEAFNVGLISGTMGALAGYGVGGGITNGAQTLAQVGGKAFLGAGISALEPIVNSVAEYAMYANEVVDENGNKVYDNMWDYYVDGGGLLNTGMAFGAGFISSGIQSYKGYRTFKYKGEFNANMNAMSDTERSAAWEDYYRQKYGDGVEHTSGPDINKPKTTTYKTTREGTKLPQWTTPESLDRGRRTLSTFESMNGISESQSTKDLWADVLENEYGYNPSSLEGQKVTESLQTYYDNRLYQQIDNNVYDTVKSNIPGAKVKSYSINTDGTMRIEYIVGESTQTMTISKFEVDEILAKSYETAGMDTMNILLHFEENIPAVGTDRTFKYEVLNRYTSGEEVVGHMTPQDIAVYESIWSERIKIDGTDKEYNFGFFTTEENIIAYAENQHIIGYQNADGTKTQWGLSLSSLRGNLMDMEYNGQKITAEILENMTDEEIQHLAEKLIAVPEGSYDGKTLVFVAGNRDINRTNMTSNSLAGANDYYTAYGRTAGNLFEADVGAVDIKIPDIKKMDINEIRNMFITLIK